MKLFYSPNSPYSRKCRVVIAEKAIAGVEMVETLPADNAPELIAANPLGRVPALITDKGLHLCESPVICEYLDSLPSSAPSLYPEGDARFCALALAALGDGIMDSAVAVVLEKRRPEDKQYGPWIERKENAVMRSIQKIAEAKLDSSLPLSIGKVSVVVALEYVSFRQPHLKWREQFPELAKWLDVVSNRKSFISTRPV